MIPFNIARTWHLQLAIFWVATGFLAAGIFLAPMIAGREPRGQHWLAYALLVALAIVVFGSLVGEFVGIHGWLAQLWPGLASQGFECLDLGRFWQILLTMWAASFGSSFSFGASWPSSCGAYGEHAVAILLLSA